MKKVLQVSLAIALVCVSSPVVAFQASQPAASAPGIPPGRSMKETEAWIKHDLPPMGYDHIVTLYKGSTLGNTYAIESAVLSECVLTIKQSSHFDPAPNRQTDTSRITMKDVDVGQGLVAIENIVATNATVSKPSYSIFLVALSDRGDPFVSETDGYRGGKTKKSVRAVGVRLRDQNEGNQAAEVFRRAAILCGAPDQRVKTALTKTTQELQSSGAPASPPSPGSSKMTNDVVIQLVSAGLSEQVVTTSIRQAPGNDFDLTTTGLIALKKAGVSDGVILVMQERSAATVSVVEAPPQPIQPPPPPPDQPPPSPKSISKGDTREQVVEALGQPERIAKLDSKEILYYKDLKVTLVNGKVTDVQ